MLRLDLSPGDVLTRGSIQYVLRARTDQFLDFVGVLSSELFQITHKQLAVEIGRGAAAINRQDPALAAPSSASLAAFSMHSTQEKDEARKRLAYVLGAREYQTGSRLSEESLLASITATARRLGDEKPPCTRTVRRWIERGGAAPTSVHMVSQHSSKGNRTPRLHHDIVDIIEARIDSDYLKRPPIGFTELHDRIECDVIDLNLHRAVPLEVPSYDAVRTAVLKRPPWDVMAARYGQPAADRAFRAVHRTPEVEAPLDRVELDHTLSDLMVVCDRTYLPMGRATIGLAMDSCSRMPWGLYIGFEPPSVHTVLQCLRNGVLPKVYVDEKIDSGEWPIKHRWEVFGKPRMLVVDRALENIGTDLDDVAGTVGFHLGVCPGRAPWFKGKIERFLNSLNRKLLHAQRGTTFSNIMERDDYDPAKNAVITLAELHYVIHRWLLDVYSCRAHDGIRDVPYRRWEDLCRKFPVQPIENIGQLDMMLGRTETRILSRSGIKFERQTYISDELVSLLSDPTFRRLSPDLAVTFKYDAGDLGQIRVFDPRFRDYISVDSDNQAYAKGLSLWQNTIIEKYAKTRLAGRVDRESIVRAKVELAAFFESAWRRNQKIGSRRTAARFQGVGRYAMAGTDHRTSPTPPAARVSLIDLATIAQPGAPDPLATIGLPNVATTPEEDIYASIGIPRLKSSG